MMSTSAVSMPPGVKYKAFKVPNKVFRRFKPGDKMSDDLKEYLDKTVKIERDIVEFYKANKDHHIVLCDEDTGLMRVIKRAS